MRLLLDTHLLLWSASGRGMSAAARALILDPLNSLHFSAASIWEVSIKAGLGRPDFRADPHLLRRGLLDNGYVEMPVSSEHAAGVASLAPIHRDPFDRMLVSQATIEGAVLLTTDRTLADYPGPIQLV